MWRSHGRTRPSPSGSPGCRPLPLPRRLPAAADLQAPGRLLQRLRGSGRIGEHVVSPHSGGYGRGVSPPPPHPGTTASRAAQQGQDARGQIPGVAGGPGWELETAVAPAPPGFRGQDVGRCAGPRVRRGGGVLLLLPQCPRQSPCPPAPREQVLGVLVSSETTGPRNGGDPE